MVEVTVIDKLFTLSSTLFSGFLFRFILAAVILLIGFVIGRMAGKFVLRLLHEIELNSLVRSATSLRLSVEEFISSMVSYMIYFFVLIWALNQLGLTTTILYILSAAVIVIIIISFMLGVRDFIPNMISGLSLQKRGFLKVGDQISVKDMEGKIEYINLIETRIITKKGDIISIPNLVLTKQEVVKKKSKK